MLQPGVCQGEDLSWVFLAMCLPLSVCHPLLTLHRHMQQPHRRVAWVTILFTVGWLHLHFFEDPTQKLLNVSHFNSEVQRA